jgi:S-adenosylmethionine synthetase
MKGILPDGKAQVIVEYKDDTPVRVKTIVVSIQHGKDKTQEELRTDILNNVLWQCFEDFPFDDETEILINPSGKFILGGPAADTGLTGRKIMVDTFGVLHPMVAELFVAKTRPKLTEVVLTWLGISPSTSYGVVMPRNVKLVFHMPLERQIR